MRDKHAQIADQLAAHAAAIREAAMKLDVSRTEPVTAADLRPGDVITHMEGRELPFPFRISKAKPVMNIISVTATHGWWGVLWPGDPVTRVLP